jgi:hypothetical protein
MYTIHSHQTTAAKEAPAESSTLAEFIQFPEQIRTGRYDAFGRRSPRGNLFITVKDTSFIWGAFTKALKPGQLGCLTFTNVPGTFLIGVSFNEWDPFEHAPRISEARFGLISIQRAPEEIRVIGKNLHDQELPAAAGIVVADDASYYP